VHLSYSPIQYGTSTATTTILQLSGFCPEQPGWAGTRRNIHHSIWYQEL